MNVIIRTDASVYIGSGHVMRCLVIAHALKIKGHRVEFVTRPQAGDLVSFIRDKGFIVHELISPQEWQAPEHTADYAAWLQVPWQEDVKNFLVHVERADLVIIDHYGIGQEWESTVKEQLACRLLVIDDLNRTHCCDLILDQNLWRDSSLRYKNSNANILIGPEFALLRTDFHKIRSLGLPKRDKVFVFFGGSDPTSECLKVIKAINELGDFPFLVQMITGRSNSDFSEITKTANKYKVEIHQTINDFEVELATSKYALGASGVSNWERFCFHIPTTIVSVADNQIELSEYLFEKGMVRYLGRGCKTTSENYKIELSRLMNSWDTLEPGNVLEVDGLGSERVAKEVEMLFI